MPGTPRHPVARPGTHRARLAAHGPGRARNVALRGWCDRREPDHRVEPRCRWLEPITPTALPPNAPVPSEVPAAA